MKEALPAAKNPRLWGKYLNMGFISKSKIFRKAILLLLESIFS